MLDFLNEMLGFFIEAIAFPIELSFPKNIWQMALMVKLFEQ